MKKNVLSFILLFVCCGFLSQAQTTDTYVVADNGPVMSSCSDTTYTLLDLLKQRGIRDLNDPSDNYSNYKLIRLDGSVISGVELTGPILFSAYPAVYVEKINPTGGNHAGVQIFLRLIDTPPTFLFDTDTLKYVVEKGATKTYGADFFNHLHFWSSGKDVLPL